MLWTKGHGSSSNSCWQNPAFIISSLATIIYPACQVTEDIARTICFPLPESSQAVRLHAQTISLVRLTFFSMCPCHLWQDFFPWVGIFTSHLLIWLASFSDINCLASSKLLLLSFPSILERVPFITSLLISSFLGSKCWGFNLLRISHLPSHFSCPRPPFRPSILAWRAETACSPCRHAWPSENHCCQVIFPKHKACVRGPDRFQSLSGIFPLSSG